MTISIRILSETDLQAADDLLSSAFQRAESWLPELLLFRRLQPDVLFLASIDGIPAGMVASVIYSNYAYVGLMGIHQEFQRKGIGLALMEHVLAWMSAQRVSLVKLDASKAGQPFYETLGFVPLEEVYLFQRSISLLNGSHPKGVHPVMPQDLGPITDYDTQVFGASRGRLLCALLELYPGRSFMMRNEQGCVTGFLLAQAKRIGPWVMNEDNDAERLLRVALSLPFNDTVSVITPANNAAAISLLKRYGFQISRVNRHMAYGSSTNVGQREKIFGQTSLSFG